MKKTILKRILALVIVFMMLISTPFYISENINNSPYANATAATFTAVLESELFLQILIPTLISAGLVFKSKEAVEKVADDTIEWLKQQGFDWKPPEEPNGPNLEDVIKEMLKAVTLVSASYELVKGIVKIPKMFWDLIKSFVDDNFKEGDNYIFELTPLGVEKSFSTQIKMNQVLISCEYNGNLLQIIMAQNPDYPTGNVSPYVYVNGVKRHYVDPIVKNTSGAGSTNIKVKISATSNKIYFNAQIGSSPAGQTSMLISDLVEYPPIQEEAPIYGYPNIVDNDNFDWNNNYTGSKDISIPIETDIYGNIKTDENEYYLPSIDTEDWIGVQPTEIPNLDPSGTPIPEIPEMPEVENQDDDEQTGILIYIGNILQPIVGQLSKIVEGVKTIVSTTNKLVFNTTKPELDPITGELVEPAAAGDGIIGNGIDTRIPTDFEWGSFRHFLDIFFIFIYFIVILILIILKFLQIVFVGIPNIAANTDLFAQYPNILEGVNYVKNLQVGGLAITVHQAFEFVFLIFFYIFIIKQIRKMYNAHVYEESAENPRISQDMKMDYYENIKNKRWSDNK
ncbi:MAG: hypothetical protein WBI36_05560 [Erysipelotrichaceae bacterium]